MKTVVVVAGTRAWCEYRHIAIVVQLTSRLRALSSSYGKATWMSTMSCGLSNVNIISQNSPSGTMACAQDHLDSMSSLMPSRVSEGEHPSS